LKRKLFVLFIILFSVSAYAQNNSLSFDPLTFLGLLFSSVDENDEEQPSDIRNLWLCVEVNWETSGKREAGVGITLRGDRFAVRTQWRNFFNRERQSGFFIGLYGIVEYRKMFWFLDAGDEITTGWNFPFIGNDNVYHSVGLSAGFDIGFRIRGESIGLTPYIGLGLPLFYCFGDLPPDKYREDFDAQNTAIRVLDIGLRVDLFR
jgi:hypothetical protein